jgi:hypothetical protein
MRLRYFSEQSLHTLSTIGTKSKIQSSNKSKETWFKTATFSHFQHEFSSTKPQPKLYILNLPERI